MGAAARADVPDSAEIVVPTEKNDEPNATQRPLNSRRFSNCLFILHSRRRSTGPTDQATCGEGDARRDMPRFPGDNLRLNLGLVEELEKHATAERCTPAQLTLAWVVSRADDIVPIPGTSHRHWV